MPQRARGLVTGQARARGAATSESPMCCYQRVSANAARRCKAAQTRANTSPVGHHELLREDALSTWEGAALGIPERGCWRRKPSGQRALLRPRTSRQASSPGTRKTCMAMQNQVSQTRLGNRKNHAPLGHTPIVLYCHQESHPFLFRGP